MGVVAVAACRGPGFVSFLAYLGYGYLDTWHGLATLVLLPCFVLGLVRARGRPVLRGGHPLSCRGRRCCCLDFGGGSAGAVCWRRPSVWSRRD